jgi:RNA polymerase sigma-70 factor (ECF subfamily)
MSDDRLTELGERLRGGDASAVEEVFQAYGPYLRMVVRRRMTTQLRSRFDSHDVVQSVWADTLLRLRQGGGSWRFRDEPALRSFLVRLTLNRFIDFYRRHRPGLARETRLTPDTERDLPAARCDRPSEVAQAEDLWAHLLAICPPAHRELLRLKTRGVPIAEIAARTGFHESSVRRILYDLADRLDADAAGPESRPAP